MIIHSLEMEHFRQYYGRQSIQFASSNEEQIVTVVLGENGRGKTGIYRAIMLAIFGDSKLEQDSSEAEIILTNLKALEEQPEGLKSSVTLSFQHNKHTYKVTRTFFARKLPDGSIKEQLLSVLMVNETTNESWSTERDTQAIIRKMVDERVKHYFFFDGERIERLTRVAASQREEIAVGIKNLLKIDHVIKSKEVLNKVLTSVKKDLEKHSKGEYKKAFLELSEKEQKAAQLVEQQSELKEQKINSENRLSEIDEQLKKFESSKALFLEREELEKEGVQINNAIASKMEQLKKMNKYLPLLLGEDTYHMTLARLRGEIDSSDKIGIHSSLISQLLENMRCICGTDLHEHTRAHQQLMALKVSVDAYEKNKDLHDLFESLQKLLSYLEGRAETASYIADELKQLHVQQEEVRWRLDELNGRLQTVGEHEINSLNDERNQLTQNLAQINFDSKRLSSEQEELKKVLERMELHVKELKRKSGIREQLLQKHDVLKSSISSITALIETFEQEVMEELERATQQNLHYLLDDAGQAMMRKVKINPDYSLEILNAFNQPFLANISQGQRQVFSISFITALAQVAGGSTTLEMPLLMDTPFGRLSSIHQQGLIEYLPQICSQWVLLVTDREFGAEEKALFAQSNRIGKFYKLTSKGPGETLIKEVDTSELG
ncbi:AAA family ATPase [Neobacillus drentensis]|uniref:AAA family ATPase n=1 Tax=Neobacillus drentensis TaxID=220684 RepID=UPI002864FE28|nr:AAA family ATPase [Neobacillus drentensis]MDR7240495.1 DNA sulfur modification protein DndD [Neobacillus drentensis]